MNRICTVVGLSFCLCTFYTCVDPLGFKPEGDQRTLVVDGRLNAMDSMHTIKLSRTEAVGRSANFAAEAGALVWIEDDAGAAFVFVEENFGSGAYELKQFKLDPNRIYLLNIELRDGTSYQSTPQLIPKPVPVDSGFIVFDKNEFITLFTQFRIPTEEEGPYFKWRVEHVYQITDLMCGPFDKVVTCYFPNKQDNQLLPVFDGSRINRAELVQKPLAMVPLIPDFYGEVTYFSIYQESLSKEAFQYWEKINRLIEQTGSIFDAPPGEVISNIVNTRNKNDRALGFFYITAETIARVKTIASDFFPVVVNPFCGEPGFPPMPFPIGCCSCGDISANRIERPDYWK